MGSSFFIIINNVCKLLWTQFIITIAIVDYSMK